MRLWARCILTISLLLAMMLPLLKVAAQDGGRVGSAVGQGVVTYKGAQTGKDNVRLAGRSAASATAVGTVIFKKPAEECPTGTERIGKACVRSCPSGMVRFGADCVSDGSGPTTVTPTPEPDPPVDLARPLQEELKRLGCLSGRVDGIWGRQSRAALSKFVKQAGLSISRREPTAAALREARDRPDGYCKPDPCPGDTYRSGGRCICDSGLVKRGDSCITALAPCPGDTYRSGGKCVCDAGLVRRGDSCVDAPPKCRGDTYLSGGKCVCDSGLVKRGDSCVDAPPTCRGDTYLSGGKCVCDSGLVKRGDSCVDPPPTCRGDTYLSGGRCICDPGKVRRGDRCVRRQRPCPGDLERDGRNCVCADDSRVRRGIRCVPRPVSCPSGYRPSNGTCVRTGPRCRSDQYVCGDECCYRGQSAPGGGGGNRRQVKKCQQKCTARLIGCMLKYNNQRKCQGQLAQCKQKYGC